MRRSVVVIAMAALVGSMLAFAPAVTAQQEAETDHEIVFTQDGSATVEGAETAVGTNLGELKTGCTKDPDTYCETVHVTVEQPVVGEDPDEFEFGTGEVAFRLAPMVPGADFDVVVYESDEAGTSRGGVVAESGNFPACAQVCDPLNTNPLIDFGGCGSEHDECGSWAVSTSELAGTRHYVMEVVYYIAAGPYTLDVAYERTDGRNFDGTTPTPVEEPFVEPADSVESLDVTGGYEPAGDWGGGGNNAAIGDALGQDLEGAYIEYADDTFTFTIDLTSLPAVGGAPEVTRYGWSFNYNDLHLELDGKFTNYSRGTCDPTAGTCPPPRDPGTAPFLIRGNCYDDTTLPITLTLCEELAYVSATFDPADGTITVPIPADALAPDGVQGCDQIVGTSSFIGESIWSAPSAFVTNTLMPNDTALHYLPFVVPPADPTLSCDG